MARDTPGLPGAPASPVGLFPTDYRGRSGNAIVFGIGGDHGRGQEDYNHIRREGDGVLRELVFRHDRRRLGEEARASAPPTPPPPLGIEGAQLLALAVP